MQMRYRRFAALVLGFALFGFAIQAGEEVAPVAQPQDQPQQQRQVSVNPAELFAVLAGEAEKGNPQAMVNLGTLYENGVGVRRNFTKAFEWYDKAATAGNPEGYMRVGAAYEIGVGTQVDLEKAFLNYEKAAEQKIPNGLYKLAEMYIHGLGVKQNQVWGVSLLERAKEAGHAGGANDLGLIYFEGLYGQQKDLAKAREMFMAAADLGNGEAMKNVGVIYREGMGLDADPVEAMKWYMLAFEAGFNQQGLLPVLQDFEQEMDKEDVEEARSRARAWIEEFQKRQQAAQAGQQPPAAAPSVTGQ